MSKSELENLTKITKDYSQVLSTPFLPNLRIAYLKKLFAGLSYQTIENHYSVTVVVPGESSQKMVYMSHLDHPGIVVKNRHQGICLGSLFPERLQKIIFQKGSIPLDIYSPEGKYLTQGKLVGLHGKYLQKATLDIPINVPPNSTAKYQIGFVKEDKDFFYLYAADNDAPTICMLNLLLNLNKKPKLTHYFVFTFYEEVHQISSFYLAKNNILKITPHDFILNLESKKIENHPQNPPQNLLDYISGPVLQPSEKDCLYGYKYKPTTNKLENFILQVAQINKIKIQYGFGLGSTDARPFSNYSITPNICTLDVPNRFKHNCDDSGNIVLEKIYKKDIVRMYQLLKLLSQADPKSLPNHNQTEILTKNLINNDFITNQKAMNQKILLNYRLNLANKIKIITKQYFPTNLIYKTIDYFLNLISYPYYFLIKFIPN